MQGVWLALDRGAFFLTNEKLRVRVEVCLEGAGKINTASDVQLDPRPPGAVAVKA
jgi:hypothetical protein